MATIFHRHWREVPERAWRWPNFSPAEIACPGTGKLLVNEPAPSAHASAVAADTRAGSTVAVRQAEDEEVRLLLDPADHHQRFAEVRLRVAGRVMQRHEHLATAPLVLAQVRLHDRGAAGEAVLFPKPI